MRRSRVNNQMYFALSALALIASGGACYLQMGNLDHYGKQVVELEGKLAQQGDVQTQLEQVTQKVKDSQQKLDHLEQGVPQRAYMPTLMTEIEALGNRNGIRVTGVRPMPPRFAEPKPEDGASAPKRPYEEQHVEVKGTGHYLKVLAFLSELESFPKIVSVQAVTLSPQNDLSAQGDSSQLDITVELKAFLFPATAPAAGRLSQGANSNEGS